VIFTTLKLPLKIMLRFVFLDILLFVLIVYWVSIMGPHISNIIADMA
jgi:hypothetical protein